MANIVVCSDGTWNRPEDDISKDFPSNVLKLARGVSPLGQQTRQHVFYDWGLGAYHDKWSAGITGHGIHKNILDGYRYIVHNYEPGDKIYLFGFSRGAYSMRALAGLIHNCGILRREHANMISKAWHIYKDYSPSCHPQGATALTFKRELAHQENTVHFVGVWDTVGALGIPFGMLGLFDGKDEFYDTKMGPNVRIARHALSIDEQREDFEPTLWLPREGVDLKQIWFAGVHGDVGGSYAPDHDSGYSVADISLRWMLTEAQKAGLDFEPHLWDSLTEGEHGQLHESRASLYRFKRPLHRRLNVPDRPTFIHSSVKLRYEMDANYRPPQLETWVNQNGWDAIPLSD
ncbi:DUF2235 domain-containing protein [Vibrio nitrifigilis]|uniref:DUF2235 domain-containing protein n=1 Tax=Vibrio nitrifigilis TaxID=2789781 RepID=A0ABS0GJ98_9VIBR|nr:DUF2235 domain-containing protein [Vibrio nitrifigilis]MBF9002508.1 DUF2235 domain-containing protein [Vibrio nitrifigilis]